MEESPAGLNDCLKLLKGERDEQRLAGLLLVTKFINKDDCASISRVYDAVGDLFLTRLLSTGMGKGSLSTNGSENRDAYLQLAVTLLASFCRVPEIACSREMRSKISLILEILSNNLSASLVEECFEILFLVANGDEDGVRVLVESGGVNVLANQMSTFPDGSHSIEIAMRLVELMFTKLSGEIFFTRYALELSNIVVTLAKQFGVLHNNLKFEALHLLSAILSSKYSAPICDALRLMKNEIWSTYVRVGVVEILQNRVAPAEKIHALVVAEAVISVVGKEWLFGRMNLPNVQDNVPADRCILLVLESSRIEIAVLLNDLAYLKFEASKSLSDADTILLKQMNLFVAFSLVENIVKLVASVSEDEGGVISENTFTKIIAGLNETTGVILEYLQDAKVHGQRKGDDLLASVRVIGSYLAETPDACKEKVSQLLDFMLSVEGEDEQSPFHSICFLLPFLCQITMEVDGCRLVALSGSHKAVVDCLVQLIRLSGDKDNVKDGGLIYLACDTLMNVLLKREEIRVRLNGADFVELLATLSCWTENTDDQSVNMMAASICSLILDFTSEDALQQHPNFDSGKLASLCQLFKRSLTLCDADAMCGGAELDLYEIVISGYSRWSERFPHIKATVGK